MVFSRVECIAHEPHNDYIQVAYRAQPSHEFINVQSGLLTSFLVLCQYLGNFCKDKKLLSTPLPRDKL